MNCMKFQRRMHRKLDGERMNGKEEMKLKEHLALCPACRDYYRQMQGLKALVKDTLTESLSSDDSEAVNWRLTDSILQKTERLSAHKPRWSLGRRLILSGVALVLVAVLSLGILWYYPWESGRRYYAEAETVGEELSELLIEDTQLDNAALLLYYSMLTDDATDSETLYEIVMCQVEETYYNTAL